MWEFMPGDFCKRRESGTLLGHKVDIKHPHELDVLLRKLGGGR
jgi:hypothetical protein